MKREIISSILAGCMILTLAACNNGGTYVINGKVSLDNDGDDVVARIELPVSTENP